MTPYYEQDGITIYHGDCRAVLGSLYEGTGQAHRAFDLLLTDPPYGIGFAAQPTTGQRARGQAKEEWDNATSPEGLAFARTLCKHQIIFGGNYYDLPIARCWLSWFKPDAPPSMGNVEYAWTNLDQNSRMVSVSIAATNAERVGHPTQKPEAVIRFALLQAPQDVRTVLDPFMGSGTTLVAAKRLGKTAVGIDLNEAYCEIAAKRLSQGALSLEMPA